MILIHCLKCGSNRIIEIELEIACNVEYSLGRMLHKWTLWLKQKNSKVEKDWLLETNMYMDDNATTAICYTKHYWSTEHIAQSLPQKVELETVCEKGIRTANPTSSVASGREMDWCYGYKQWFCLNGTQRLWVKPWNTPSWDGCLRTLKIMLSIFGLRGIVIVKATYNHRRAQDIIIFTRLVFNLQL